MTFDEALLRVWGHPPAKPLKGRGHNRHRCSIPRLWHRLPEDHRTTAKVEGSNHVGLYVSPEAHLLIRDYFDELLAFAHAQERLTAP